MIKKELINKNFILVLIALILLLLPNIAMIFLSGDSIVATTLKKIVFLAFSASFFSLLLLIKKLRLTLLISVLILVIGCIEIYSLINLKSHISIGIGAAIFNTNIHEAMELLSSSIDYILAAIIYICLYIGIVVSISKLYTPPKLFKIIIIICFISLQSLILLRDVFIAKNINNEKINSDVVKYFYTVKLRKTFPINWILNYNYFLEGKELLDSYESITKNFKFGATQKEEYNSKQVYIIVIGETARRNNFSIYDYTRNTNPRLSSRSNLFAFNNVITGSTVTSYSYPLFMSRSTPENFELCYSEPSIIQPFNEAGFKTYYISNQNLEYGSIYQLYAQQADSLIELNADIDKLTTDGDVLPHLKNILKTSNQKMAIFIHSLGSHFRYNLRYKTEFNIYKPNIDNDFSLTSLNSSNKDKLINSYDNSILYTDYFLDEVIKQLNELNCLSYLFYASDHGENLFDDKRQLFAHGSSQPSKYELEIPNFVWLSDKYINNFKEKFLILEANLNAPISSIHFFHTILDLAHIQYPEELKSESFASEKFKKHSIRYIYTPDGKVSHYP